MYPTKLKERVQEHRKEHGWDVGYKPAFAEANKQLQDFETDVGKVIYICFGGAVMLILHIFLTLFMKFLRNHPYMYIITLAQDLITLVY